MGEILRKSPASFPMLDSGEGEDESPALIIILSRSTLLSRSTRTFHTGSTAKMQTLPEYSQLIYSLSLDEPLPSLKTC